MKSSRTLLVCVLLAAVTVAAYWPVLSNDFIKYDDANYITENRHVASGLSWANIKWAFTTDYASNWHPLTWLSHQLDVQLFGLRPGWHHLVSLLLHIANTLLLFVVLRKIARLRPTTARQAPLHPPPAGQAGLGKDMMTDTTWRCAMVAALFAVHPLHVESVAWAAERKDVLSTFFFMLTLWAYAEYVQSPKSKAQSPETGGVTERENVGASEPQEGTSKRRSVEVSERPEPMLSRSNAPTLHAPRSTSYYALSLFFFACGLMSKPMLVTTPFVLLLLDYWPLRRFATENQKSRIKSLVWEKLPFLALCAASSVMTFLVQQKGHAVSTAEGLPLEPRITNTILSYVKYLAKTFWPVDLAVFYPHLGIRGPEGEPADWLLAMAALLLVVITVSVLLRRKSDPWLAVGWFWFVGTLVPVIGIVQVGGQAMADRYMYIPSLGLFILLVWGAADFFGGRPFGRVALIMVGIGAAAACSAVTYRQTKYWRNNSTLFEHALAVTSSNYVAEYNLGLGFGEQGEYDRAISHFRAALEVYPSLADAHYSLGVSLEAQGKVDEAVGEYLEALRAKPWHVLAHYGLGGAYRKLGKPQEAVAEYREALRLDPDFPQAHYDLGTILYTEGHLEEAASELAETVRLKPDDGPALLESAKVFVKQGKLLEAERCCRQAIRLSPKDAGAHINLGEVLGMLGKRDEAVKQLTEALHLKPDDANAHKDFGTAMLEQGKYPDAATHFAEAVRLKPDSADFRVGLGRALLLSEKLDEASKEFEQAARLHPDAQTYYDLGMVRVMQGNSKEAVADYQQALRLNPDNLPALNDLAWLLATDPHSETRNGAEAVRLAEHARNLSGGKTARFWGTLDAAYAESGRWTEAIQAAQKAKELALGAGEKELAEAAERRMALYEKRQPFRQ